MIMILPGDIVTFFSDDPEVNAQIIESIKPKAPDRGIFLTSIEALKLQATWRVRGEIMSESIYLVVCASRKRAMVFSSKGRILVTETRFLNKLNQENDQC